MMDAPTDDASEVDPSPARELGGDTLPTPAEDADIDAIPRDTNNDTETLAICDPREQPSSTYSRHTSERRSRKPSSTLSRRRSATCYSSCSARALSQTFGVLSTIQVRVHAIKLISELQVASAAFENVALGAACSAFSAEYQQPPGVRLPKRLQRHDDERRPSPPSQMSGSR